MGLRLLYSVVWICPQWLHAPLWRWWWPSEELQDKNEGGVNTLLFDGLSIPSKACLQRCFPSTIKVFITVKKEQNKNGSALAGAQHNIHLLRDGCLTRWVPNYGYIHHQNDHLSGRMTDISVMGEWQVVGVGGTRPLRNVLGEALKGRFSFEARNYLFSFPSYVHFEEFFVSRAFVKFGAKRSSPGTFCFDDVLELFLKTALRHRAFSCELRLRPRVFFENFHSCFKPEPRCYLPDSYVDPQVEQSSLVMVRRKLEWKLDFRALARSSAKGPSIVVAISTSRLQWSMVQNRQKARGSQRVIALYRLQNQQGNQRVFWGACFRDPMFLPFCTSLFPCMWLYSSTSVRLQIGDSEEKQSSVTFPVLVTEP